MKRMIFILVILFVALSCTNAQVKVYTDQLIADSISYNGTTWINEWSIDGTMGGNSDRAVPTEKAVKTYVDAQIGVSPTSLRVSIDSLGDTTAVHNTRIKANLTLINSHTTSITNLNDSISKHTDTLQSHNNRLKVLESGGMGFDVTLLQDTQPDTVVTANKDSLSYYVIDLDEVKDSLHTHANKSTLDDITSPFTTAKNTRLEGINDTILVMVRVTDDTLTSTEVFSGYILPIGRTLNGCNLIQAEAFSPGNGDGTAAIKIYRMRSAARETVTTTGADINSTATIDTGFDDVQTGDYYDFGFKETGAAAYTVAVDMYLKFLRP